jgi:WD40 repeat protein
MRPGAHPFEELASALTRIAVNPPVDLVDRLERGEDGLGMTTSLLLPPGTELVLVIDQFEELFTLLDDDDARTRFLAALSRAASDPGSRVHVLVTLRADFYDRPLTYAGLAELMKARSVVVTPLVPEEIERAVAGPAEGVGVRIEPALVADIVAEVAAQPGALPLLQYALTEMFERRDGSSLTSEGYREIGGVSAALPRRAEDLYRRMNQAGQAAARQLFLRLITLGTDGSEDTRRRVLRSELTSLVDVDAEAMGAVIETFGARRLLSFDHDPVTRGPTVEVAHEALLREWDRLRGWVEGAREDVRAHRRLYAAAREWTDSGRDPSFLLRGRQLERYEAWTSSSGLALTGDERAYLDASLAQRATELADEASRSARETALERRSARRLRALVAVFAAAALIAGSLTVAATNQRRRAERGARVATARELAAASVANLEADPELSVLLAIEAVRTTRSADGLVLPEAADALHRAVTASRLEFEVPELGGLLAWSPRGVFVTEGPEDSGLIDVREAETGERVRSFHGHEGDVTDVAFSPDGSLLASTGEDGMLKVWDASMWRLVFSHSAEGGAWGPSFSADGSLVSAVWNDYQVLVLDLSTDQLVSEIHTPFAIDTALSPDGRRVAVATFFSDDEEEGTGAVFDVSTREEVFTLRGLNWNPTPASRGVSWSPDGRYVAVSSMNTARVWDATTGALHHTLVGHTDLVLSLAWSPDSSRLVTGSSDGTAKVWELDPEGVRERWSLSAEEMKSGIVGVALSPDGTRVLAGDASISAVKVWDLGPNGDAEWGNFPAAGRPAAEFMPDGRRIVTTSPDGADFESGRAVTIWDLQTGRDVQTLGPATDPFRFLASDVRPDGGSIALGGSSTPSCCGGASAARAWDPSTDEELYSVGHALDVNEVAFSPDGELLATASWDGTAKIVDRSGSVIRVLGEWHGPGDTGRGDFAVFDVAFSSDGRLLATAEYADALGGRVRIWDWARGKLVLTIDVDSPSYPQVDFDPTGPRLALTGSDGLAEVWDVDGGERSVVLAGPPGGVNDLAFSPGGSRIAIASAQGSVRLFDAGTGAPQLVLRGSGCAMEGVAFGPDGTKLASSSGCDGVRIWALDIDDLLEIGRREAGTSLTDEECRQYLHMDRCPER